MKNRNAVRRAAEQTQKIADLYAANRREWDEFIAEHLKWLITSPMAGIAKITYSETLATVYTEMPTGEDAQFLHSLADRGADIFCIEQIPDTADLSRATAIEGNIQHFMHFFDNSCTGSTLSERSSETQTVQGALAEFAAGVQDALVMQRLPVNQ